jgi:hypothetical protein
MSTDLDLSGEWTGFFNYPRLLPPTNFTASLRDHGGALAGETAEPDLHNPGNVLHAVIDGTRDGSEVSFTKIYDDLLHAADVVHYRGTVQAGGDEIEGSWDIPGVWSGTFLMIRGAGAAETIEREVTEEVR